MIAPDRWSQVEKLFGSLLELPVEARRGALEAVEDPDLRVEVSELLSMHEDLAAGDDGFLEHLDAARARSLLDQMDTGNEEPRTIGHYRILRRIGRGGMGIVYHAHDPRLDRSVAIKLLPPYLAADPAAVRRLTAEARAASALDHPNIETVYEIGETDLDQPFIAMAYYEGETLRERISAGSLPVETVIDLGVQLAEGLGAAHRSGIIHRDIKPENLLVTRDGVLKIVDFGVAKVVKDGLATAGLPRGTAVYMSPEQTRGEAVDQRTDVWSAGVVLYEMLAGSRPFRGEGEALIHAIRCDSPPPLSTIRSDLPPALVTIVERCLEKNPARRLESADSLARALRGASEGAIGHPPSRRRLPRVLLPYVLAISLLVGAAGLYGLISARDRTSGSRDAGEAALPAVAVLPFEARGSGLDIWREGMVDLLSVNLDGVQGLRAIDSRTVLARWRERAQDTGPDLERALEVARATGARYAVIGSVVSSGSRMRLGAQIYRLDNESSLASLQVVGPPDSLFALVDRLSIDVLAAIWQGWERPRAQVDLTRITTTSLPALEAFLEGESHFRRAEFERAVGAYERALAADSTFAFALYHLSQAYAWMDEETIMGQTYQRVLRHAGRLPEREARLLRAGSQYGSPAYDFATKIGLLQEVTRKYPDDADAWYMLGDAYFHGAELVLAGQYESERAFRKAAGLDPGFALPYIHIVNNAFLQSPDSARVARLIDIYHRLAPNSDTDQENRIAFGLAFGDSIRRREALAALDTLPPRSPSLENLSSWFLDHPRFWAQREVVLARRPRTNSHPGPFLTFQLFDTYLSQGKVRAALASLEDPLMLPGVRAAGFYTIHLAGLPVPEPTLARELALSSTDDLSTDIGSLMTTFYAGAYAADKGRWAEHTAAVARLRRHADRLRAAGDSAASRFASGAASALTGRGLWRRGDARRALPLLTDGQRQATWTESQSRDALNETIRWWLGEILLDVGRPHEAARYFESFWNDPLAAHRLARIYEQLGDRAKAREAHALVAFAWQDADPEFQPRVRTARAAVERLTRSGRE